MHDRECLFSEKVYHMLHFSTTKNKGQMVPGLVYGTKSIKAKEKPLTFLLDKRMNTDCKDPGEASFGTMLLLLETKVLSEGQTGRER